MSMTENELATTMAPMLDEMISGVGMAAEAWFKMMAQMEMHQVGMKEGEPEEGWLQIVNSLSLITTILYSLTMGFATTDSVEAKSLEKKASELNEHFLSNLVALQILRRQR